MTIEIRELKEQDINDMIDIMIEVRNFHNLHTNNYYAPMVKTDEIPRITQLLNDDKSINLVAINDGKVQGYLLVEKRHRPFLSHPDIYYISDFGIKEGCKNSGIGTHLHNKLLELAKANNIYEIKLGVLDFNKSAQAFYNKQGYQTFEHSMSLKV